MKPHLLAWMLTGVTLLLFALVGPALGSSARPLFLAICGLLGWHAWRIRPSTHVQVILLLFLFTPLIRRLIDLSVGYDNASIMILGPLIAMLPACGRALDFIEKPDGIARTLPMLIVAVCVLYAAILTMIVGDWNSLARDSVKWGVPLAYAIALLDRGDPDEILDGAAAIFSIILPIIGVYGIVQYVNPSGWDRYWMQSSPILSIGQPLPYQVRVFSTMNSPASFATFTSIGLLLVWFRSKSWVFHLLLIPSALALALTLYRTAWTSLFVAMLFCTLFKSTRLRIIPALVGIIFALFIMVTFTPFGDVITERFATLAEGSQDGSAGERLHQYLTLWAAPDSYLFGVGFTTLDVGVAGTISIDGMIIACWYSMGIIVGLWCLGGIVWACIIPINFAFEERGATEVLLGAFALFFLTQVPLAGITTGETGYLFWTFVVMTFNLRWKNIAIPRKKVICSQ